MIYLSFSDRQSNRRVWAAVYMALYNNDGC